MSDMESVKAGIQAANESTVQGTLSLSEAGERNEMIAEGVMAALESVEALRANPLFRTLGYFAVSLDGASTRMRQGVDGYNAVIGSSANAALPIDSLLVQARDEATAGADALCDKGDVAAGARRMAEDVGELAVHVVAIKEVLERLAGHAAGVRTGIDEAQAHSHRAIQMGGKYWGKL